MSGAGESEQSAPGAPAPTTPGAGAGGCQVEYTAEETPMVEYANVHFALDSMRQEAKTTAASTGTRREGPRVLILGPEDAGKTSLAKILTGYAIKSGQQPVVVNLDPSEGMLSVPGSLTAAAFRTMIDIEQGWGSSPMSGPSPVPVKLPITYFYGLPSPLDADGSVYKPIVSRMALAVTGRLAEDENARESGIIVDAPGILGQGKGGCSEIIHHIVTEFSSMFTLLIMSPLLAVPYRASANNIPVSTILVLGSERLYSLMVKSYDNKPTSNPTTSSNERISVVKLAKSGGVVDRDQSFMKSLRESQIRSYFFGNPIPSTASSALSLSATSSTTNITLSPHAQQLDFDSLTIYNIVIGGDDENEDDEYDPSRFLGANDSLLPGDSGERETTPNPLQNLQQQLQTQQQQQQQGENAASAQPAPFKKLTGQPSMALENTLLAITHAAPNASPSEIRDSSIMGFLYVVDVDDKKGKIRVLAPVGGRVPSRAMTWGRRWPGEVIGLVA